MWYKLTLACLWILFRRDENRHYPALKLAIERDRNAMLRRLKDRSRPRWSDMGSLDTLRRTNRRK
jgi:hypothetical protein